MISIAESEIYAGKVFEFSICINGQTEAINMWVCFSVFLQDKIDAAVKQLLTLKEEYKQATGQDYKPGAAPAQKTTAPTQSSTNPAAPAASGLYEKVAEQGEMVRKLKAEKAPKVSFTFHTFSPLHSDLFLAVCDIKTTYISGGFI